MIKYKMHFYLGFRNSAGLTFFDGVNNIPPPGGSYFRDDKHRNQNLGICSETWHSTLKTSTAQKRGNQLQEDCRRESNKHLPDHGGVIERGTDCGV